MAMFSAIYTTLIRKHRDATAFIVLFFFIIFFIASRIYVYLDTLGFIPEILQVNANIRGVHVHHFSYGFILLTIAGFLALYFHGKKAVHLIAALYGCGLAMAYDEFGMWLHLKDDYWVRQSYDAMALIFVFLVNIVYFPHLWQKIFLKLLVSVMTLLNLRQLRAQQKKNSIRHKR